MPTTSFLELPHEIQLKIAEHLSAVDLMQLRGVAKAFYENDRLKQLTLEKIQAESFLIVGGNNFIWCSAGRAFGCGNNSMAQLGLGDSDNHGILTKIPLPFPPSEGINQVIIGYSHTIFLTKRNRVFACGECYYGKNLIEIILPLENGDFVTHISAYSTAFFITRFGRLFAFGGKPSSELDPNEEAQKPIELILPLAPNDNIYQINTDTYDTVFLSKAGRVFARGKNMHNRLGLGETISFLKEPTELIIPLQQTDRIEQIFLSATGLFLLTRQGRIFVCGSNKYSSLGLGSVESPPGFTELTFLQDTNPKDIFTKIFAYNTHAFFVTSLGSIFACGSNKNNLLGCKPDIQKKFGPYKHYITLKPTQIPFPPKEKIKQISNYNMYCAFFVSESNRLFVAGDCLLEKKTPVKESTNPVIPRELEILNSVLETNQTDNYQVFTQQTNTFLLTNHNYIFTLFVWGSNYNFSLGTNNSKEVTTPTKVHLPQPDI